MEEKLGIYEDFCKAKNRIEFELKVLEEVLLNGKNETANMYIEKAIPELRRALSYMSDAEFELYTSPNNEI